MSRIGIIGGAGTVGSTIAFALILKNVGSMIILVDTDREKCEAQVDDLCDAAASNGDITVMTGDYNDLTLCNLIIVAAGVKQSPGMTDQQLVQYNREVMLNITNSLRPNLPKDVIILVISNPVDTMTTLVLHLIGLPPSQVFGTGTSLDTVRLHHELRQKVSVPSKYIGAYVLGEHDGHQFINWEEARVFDQTHLEILHEMRNVDKKETEERVRSKAERIIARKGYTQFGIGAVTAEICQSIIEDKSRVHVVSQFLPEYGCCLGMPALIGRTGIKRRVPVNLTAENGDVLRDAATKVNRALH